MSINFKGKKVFITGGTGFIGTHLCKKLTELGAEITVLVHKTEYSGGYAHQVLGDLTDVNTGFQLFVEKFQPEIVFHLAAQPLVSVAAVNGLNTIDTNVRGTYNFLDACKGVDSIKSFVHISTDKVYGNISPITDSTVIGGVHHPYNTSKLASDYLAQMYSNFYNIPMVIVRNANVYGAGDKHFDRIVPHTIEKVFKGERPVIRGDGSNTRDYIHVDDIVNGYLRAASLPYKNKLTTLNLSGMNYSVLDVVDTVLLKMARVDLCPVFEPLWKGEIPHQHIENDKAFHLIDWMPTIDLDKGLDLTIPWYVEYLKNVK